MESSIFFPLAVAAVSVFFLLFVLSSSSSKARPKLRLPPGPRGLPIIGNMLSVKPPLHESFRDLCKVYGPVVYLRLGSLNTVVVGSAEAAKEVLRTRDSEYASRPRTAIFDVLSFDYNGLIGAPYGDTWRHIRRISTVHLFAPTKLAQSSTIRLKEVHNMVRKINKVSSASESNVVNFTSILHQTVIDSAFNLLFGTHHYGGDAVNSAPGTVNNGSSFVRAFLKAVLDEGFVYTLSDFFPSLRCVTGSSAAERRFRNELVPRITDFIMQAIQDHRANDAKSGGNSEIHDFVTVLTRLKGEDAIGDKQIVALLADMLVGGTSTSEAAIDYAMAEMVRQPHILTKAKQEIDSVVGPDRPVQESDTASLPYMQAIVKETLRLHPGAPVGLPHYNPEQSRIGNYDIPAGSTVFVNLWGIGRDPATWTNPDQFYPERFVDSEVNPLGNYPHFIPFGAGRRICVGYPLAMRFIPYALATLLHAFDWSPPPGTKASDIDMSDTVGAGLHRAKDLVVTAVPRVPPTVYV